MLEGSFLETKMTTNIAADRTFEHWVSHVARAGDNPRGDFIRDTRGVIERGRWGDRRVETYDQLETAMHVIGRPCNEALVQAEVCWADYNRWAARKS